MSRYKHYLLNCFKFNLIFVLNLQNGEHLLYCAKLIVLLVKQNFLLRLCCIRLAVNQIIS